MGLANPTHDFENRGLGWHGLKRADHTFGGERVTTQTHACVIRQRQSAHGLVFAVELHLHAGGLEGLASGGMHLGLAVVQHGPCFAVVARRGDVVDVDIKRSYLKQTYGRPLGGKREVAGEYQAGKAKSFEVSHELTIPPQKLARALQYLCR